MSKADRAEKIAYIARVNQEGSARAAQSKPLYDKPVLTDPRNPVAVAEKLSRRYPTMAVSVKWISGVKTVHVEPIFAPIPVPTDGSQAHDVDRHHKSALDAESKVDREFWPPHSEIASYAAGYNDSPDHTDELARLKDELKTYKDQERRMRGPFPPWHHFPWG